MFRGLIFPLLIVGFLLLIVGAFLQQAMPATSAIVMTIGGTMMAVYLLGNISYDWLRHRQARHRLRDRPQLDSATFGSEYFGDMPNRPELAAQVRDSLATYLKLSLDGLLPDDDLNDVCDAQTDDPSLVWHLEEEFRLGKTFDDAEDFESIEQAIRTFRGVLSFVESRINQTQRVAGG